ncbi:ABC transporter ATP-binding protein [Elizabethkingia meningoseptica]|uniref:ABC transporter ATP-binding protein n=1 Tax=Elizabethkingia meningoseptica TaxID=238 RepID=UPI0023AEF633|nr:ABC transporter ATP-binding protein [Elizabethkingia meningoseptica]MDE5466639.1 ABC transporter ATP-binding protein [Elizabethkingia meningoseptica]MDE5474131.1 ABC transporter ATP-binding protein [Elizabethkingia meningoseptica]MDE5477564.1 ABC transporter ATP-binding protein [Elizabethkingia meningoseptica]MDE5483958.1 ABC transporter ATP-binding protein [Elizabethkingia meningoseptica]MDE5500963.1 ABC transporter ATP-binding protein [Elizabethkingia meningoseptica]
MENVLSVRNLTKKFKRTVVNNISFNVEKGNVYGLLGPNGSGKSTTFGMLLTTINPTSGEWSWFGEKGTTPDTLKKIGAIIEQPNFYPYLSAAKNLKIVAEIKGAPYSEIDKVLSTVGLLERKNDAFRTFSLGMKQRLAIASALLNNPQVLILDEPTNGLDPEGIIQIREIISNIAKQGITIIIASHLLDEIEKICSHVIVLKEGNAIYSGSVDAMTNSKGYFELKADNNEQLLNILEELSLFSGLKQNGELIIANISDDISASDLNKKLTERGIYLSHLAKKKQSLESQFLELVKK